MERTPKETERTETRRRTPQPCEERNTPAPALAAPAPLVNLGALGRDEFDAYVARLSETYLDARRRYLRDEMARVGGLDNVAGQRLLGDLQQQGRYMGLLRKADSGTRREAKEVYRDHGRDKAIAFLGSALDRHGDRRPAKRAA